MESLRFRLGSFDFSIQVAVAIILGLIIGVASFLLPPMVMVFLIIGIPVSLIAIQVPEIAILAIITLLCTLVPDTIMPMINIGIGDLYITDLILIILLAMIILRWLTDAQFRLARNIMGLPVFAFCIWATFTTIIALMEHRVQREFAVPELRTIAYYLLFFVVSNLVVNRRGLHFLISGMIFLATVVASAMLVQLILGDAFPIIPGRVEPLVTEDVVFPGITRIADTLGEGLITVAFITKTAIIFIRRFQFRRFADIFQWAVIGVGVILTFSRTHWLVTGLAMVMTFFLIRQQDRITLVKWALILFFLFPVILVPMLVNPDSLATKLVYASVQRALSLNPENVFSSGTSTFRWRDFEYVYGIPQVIAHPVMGMGLGAIYRPVVFTIDYPGLNMQHYTHNSHLWVAMKTGLVGYFLLLIMSFIYVWRGFKYWSQVADPYFGGVALGLSLSYMSALIAGLIHPIFVTLYWTPLLGTMMGINEAIYRLDKEEKASLSISPENSTVQMNLPTQ